MELQQILSSLKSLSVEELQELMIEAEAEIEARDNDFDLDELEDEPDLGRDNDFDLDELEDEPDLGRDDLNEAEQAKFDKAAEAKWPRTPEVQAILDKCSS